MAKRRKSSDSVPFSIENLGEEAAIEITNENTGSKILADLRSINLNRLDHVSHKLCRLYLFYCTAC